MNAWLKVGELFPETSGLGKVIQDHMISVSNYKKLHFECFQYYQRHLQKMSREIRNHSTHNWCMLCNNSRPLHPHRKEVANIVYQELAIKCGLLKGKSTRYYAYEPQSVLETS